MYFPLSELHGWGKRFAVQPKTIYSEVPYPSITSRSIITAKPRMMPMVAQ